MFPVRDAWDELYEVVWPHRFPFSHQLPEGRRRETGASMAVHSSIVEFVQATCCRITIRSGRRLFRVAVQAANVGLDSLREKGSTAGAARASR